MVVSYVKVAVKIGNRWEKGTINLFSMRINLYCGLHFDYNQIPKDQFKLQG